MNLRRIVVLLAWAPTLATCAEAQDSERVEIVLHDPLSYSSPGNRCEAPICTSLLKLIDAATNSIDFAIYGARNQTAILEGLLRAKARGVRIRGIVDRDARGANYYTSTDEWVATLRTVSSDRARETTPDDEGDYGPQCSRPPEFDGPLQCLAYDLGTHWLTAEHASRTDFTDPEFGGVNRIMHNKFFVVDGRYVWTGSANLSDSGTGGYNANVVLLADAPALADLYRAELDQMLGRNSPGARKVADGVEQLSIGDAELTLWFSPQDNAMQFGVQGLIARARTSIDVAVFYLTNKWVTADLINAHRRGVRVRVIVDATSARNGYTKHEILREAGIPTKVENWGGKMHMKAAVIDDEVLVLGSMNWTRAGEDTNDENTLLLRSPRLARQFSTFFDGLWQSVPDRWLAPHARPDPEGHDSGSSCFDGVDNDFDDLADDLDPGCSRSPPPAPPLPPHRLEPKGQSRSPPGSHILYPGLTCDPSYPQWFVCLPERPPGRDLDCGQIPYRNVVVTGRDPHRLDMDGDGRGCVRMRR